MHIIATIRHEVAYFKNTCIALDALRHLYETDADCKRKTPNHEDIDDTGTNGALCKILMCLAFIWNVIRNSLTHKVSTKVMGDFNSPQTTHVRVCGCKAGR